MTLLTYRITSEGRLRLAEEHDQWQAVNSTLQGIWNLAVIGGRSGLKGFLSL